jgi:hypothetical protein
METIIGFVVGYLVGSREGQAGLERLKKSWHTIRTSPEVRRLAGEAISLAEAAARQTSGLSPGKLGGAVARTVIQRATAGDSRDEAPRAA